MTDESPDQQLLEEAEEVDAVPVLAGVRALEPVRQTPLAVQAAAVAATGFVAGAATLAVVHHHRVKKQSKRQSRARRQVASNIVMSRSFLLDVHLLGSRD